MRRSRIPELSLVAAIFSGSLGLMLGIPAAWWWMVSRIEQEGAVYWLALVSWPVPLVLWALVLGRVNGAYLRLTTEDAAKRPVLEVSLVIAFVLAVICFAILLITTGESSPENKGFTPA